MSALFPDTEPEAARVLIELLRRAPDWRKLQMVDDLNQALRQRCANRPALLARLRKAGLG